jgi:hypothetical protein
MQVEESYNRSPNNSVNDTILSQRRKSTPAGLGTVFCVMKLTSTKGKKELIQAWREKASDEATLLDSLSPTSQKSDKKDDGTPENIGNSVVSFYFDQHLCSF